MRKQKWNWAIDQWLEDRVWNKVPKEYATPHFFFVLGFVTALILFFVILIVT